MDVLTLVAGLLLVGGCLALILYPLWRQSHTQPPFIDHIAQSLDDSEARYQAALASIKELMHDNDVGKLAPEDYEPLLTKAKLEAAQIRQQVDRLSRQVELDPDLDAEIERLVAQLKDGAPADRQVLAVEVEAEISLLKSAEPENGAARACSQCGKAASADDAYCSGCGQVLTDPEISAGDEPETDCPQCGQAFQPEDAFCARCGLALPQTNTQTFPETSP